MSINYIVGDMITRIRNGQKANLHIVKQKKTKLCLQILDILYNEGFIRGYKFSKDEPNFIEILLKYYNSKPSIKNIQIISKPSQRIYISVKNLYKLEKYNSHGLSLLILSTPKGIITNHEAKFLNVGGEVICKIF